MASETTILPLHLPVIDFSNKNLNPGEPEWDLTRSNVLKALQDYGCFEASFDKIPIQLRRSIFGTLEELFDLPLETKLRNVSEKAFEGYVGQHPGMPLYEAMGIGDSDIAANINAVTENLWPQGNESFSTSIHSFAEKLSELNITVRRMIMESFGLVKYMDEHLHSVNYLLRVMKYKGPETEDTNVALHAHADTSTLTILYQNHVDGLEVQTKDKNWRKVKPSQDSFIVMVGESLHTYLNGGLHPPYHRVMMTGTELRYSLGLFALPKVGYIVSSPDELVDEEHPRLFKPYDFGDFLKFFDSSIEKGPPPDVRTYCGM